MYRCRSCVCEYTIAIIIKFRYSNNGNGGRSKGLFSSILYCYMTASFRCTQIHIQRMGNVKRNAGSKSSSHRCFTSLLSYWCFCHFPVASIQKNKRHTTAIQYSHEQRRLEFRLFLFLPWPQSRVQAHTKNAEIIIIWIHAFFILWMPNNNESGGGVRRKPRNTNVYIVKMLVTIVALHLMNHIPHTVCQPYEEKWHALSFASLDFLFAMPWTFDAIATFFYAFIRILLLFCHCLVFDGVPRIYHI